MYIHKATKRHQRAQGKSLLSSYPSELRPQILIKMGSLKKQYSSFPPPPLLTQALQYKFSFCYIEKILYAGFSELFLFNHALAVHSPPLLMLVFRLSLMISLISIIFCTYFSSTVIWLYGQLKKTTKKLLNFYI